MKINFSRILAFVLVAVLVMAPTTAQAATSNLTLVYNFDGFRMFQYQPDPYHLYNDTTQLGDFTTSDGDWHVPAGKQFSFSACFKEACNFSYIVNIDGQLYTYTSLTNRPSFDVTLPVKSTNSIVRVIVLSGSSNVYIDSYYGVWN